MQDTNVTVINFDAYRQPWTFAVLLIVAIPAIFCTLVILTFLFSHWHSMITKALHHHAVFLLIMISFLYIAFDLPFSLNYFRIGYHPYRSIPFCLWWYWYDYSLLMMTLSLTATASIQRHILIFRAHWLQTRKRRWMLHYIPLINSICYPPLFYIVFMFLYPCTVYIDYSEGWCAYPCYIDNIVLYNIDWFCNIVLPVFIIVAANIALIIRVIRSMNRVRLQQRGTWKRQKKLTLQLLAFSSLYLIIWFPTTVVAILHALVFPNLYDDIPNLYYIYHLLYFVCPLQTFPCIFALPELTNFIKRKVKRLTTRTTVVPGVTRRPIA